MSQRTARSPVDRRNYWIGIGLGMIPVVLLWIALGLSLPVVGKSSAKTNPAAGPLAVAGLALYGISILAAIIALTMARLRRLGYGLLTMVFVGPVVWSVGCVVILQNVH